MTRHLSGTGGGQPNGSVHFASSHRRKPPVLTPGLVEIGNWTPSPEKRQQPVRNFVGCMDDFSFVATRLPKRR